MLSERPVAALRALRPNFSDDGGRARPFGRTSSDTKPWKFSSQVRTVPHGVVPPLQLPFMPMISAPRLSSSNRAKTAAAGPVARSRSAGLSSPEMLVMRRSSAAPGTRTSLPVASGRTRMIEPPWSTSAWRENSTMACRWSAVSDGSSMSTELPAITTPLMTSRLLASSATLGSAVPSASWNDCCQTRPLTYSWLTQSSRSDLLKRLTTGMSAVKSAL